MTLRIRTAARVATTAIVAAGVGLSAALTASAHVTVRPDIDTSGSWSKLTFRVPNESATAGTVGLRIEIPTETPFRSVRAKPQPGWTVEITREPLPEPVEVGGFVLDEAVTTITWTADDGMNIGPDQFDEFELSVGPLPEPGEYPLPADQIYDDGQVVSWADAPDSDHPAPLLTVVEGDGTSDAHGAASSEADHDDVDSAAESSAVASDPVARGLSIGALAVGVLGVGFLGSLFRRRRA